jgi:hypothetical protein
MYCVHHINKNEISYLLALENDVNVIDRRLFVRSGLSSLVAKPTSKSSTVVIRERLTSL